MLLRKIANLIGGLLFLALFVTFLVQITARFGFNQPLPWSDELAVILDAWEKETTLSPFKREFPGSRLTKAQFSPSIDLDDIPF